MEKVEALKAKSMLLCFKTSFHHNTCIAVYVKISKVKKKCSCSDRN